MVAENLISPSNIADQTINFNGMPDSFHEELNDGNKNKQKKQRTYPRTYPRTKQRTRLVIFQRTIHS